MKADRYTPLSSALWEFMEAERGYTEEMEWEHSRLMDEIVASVNDLDRNEET